MTLKPWIARRYEYLLEHFGEEEFGREDAYKLLKDKFGDEIEEVSRILSDIKKAGLLKERVDIEDKRVKIYHLVRGEEFTRGDLESIMKRAADLIRTRVDYKYILILLFLKRMSDKWVEEYRKKVAELISQGIPKEIAEQEARNPDYHSFALSEEFLWDEIRKDVNKLPEKLSNAIKKISESNPELRGIFDTVEFISFTLNRENLSILHQLVELFSGIDLSGVSSDILGDAYEWVLRYFAPQKAKEGEVYTPREVIRLLVRIVAPKPGDSVYDPAVGSGGMLIESYRYVRERYGDEVKKLFLYGQEQNQTTYGLCRMNLIIHDINSAEIALGDSLLYPKILDGAKPRKFDIVIANPPWNQDGYAEERLKMGEFWSERFEFGFPTKQSADWAWIQHMLYSSRKMVGVVIDNGALFRGGREKKIRAKILNEDWIESVILLPEKLFYNTGAPGAIIIFNKSKDEARKKKVLFINASQEYEKHPDVKKLNILSEKNIERIVEAYREFSEEKGFSRVVSHEEIKENDYNLNVTLYVFPEVEEEEIDVDAEWNEIKKINEEMKEVDARIEEYLRVIK
ncbi:MAG: SAM-dependent DNA methyltransferase [Euryarchaeota archaeon]|nr:SAM-dependent DNA methyltransferase [Euryarchaeota archaeon]